MSKFTCALANKILLQGRLYITTKRLCFHSYFNKYTLFGRETKVIVPLNEIKKIEKRYNAVIFDNSIAVLTKETELFFTSFVFRDQAYALMQKLLNQDDSPHLSGDIFKQKSMGPGKLMGVSNDKTAEVPISMMLEDGFSKKSADYMFGEIDRLDRERQKAIDDKIFAKSDFKNDLLNFKFPYPIQVVYNALFSETRDNNFYLSLLGVKSEFNIVLEKHDKVQPAQYYTNEERTLDRILTAENEESQENFLQDIKNWPLQSQKVYTFTHPIVGIPFAPKTCECREEIDLCWISPKRVTLQIRTINKGFPFADCFHVIIRWDLVQNLKFSPDGQSFEYETTVECKYYIHFIKSTMFGSKINSNTGAGLVKVYQEVVKGEITQAVEKAYKKFVLKKNMKKDAFVNYSYNEKIPPNMLKGCISEEIKKSSLQIEHLSQIRQNQMKIFSGILLIIMLNLAMFILIIKLSIF